MYLKAQIRILTRIVINLNYHYKTTKYFTNPLFTGNTFVFNRREIILYPQK